MFSIGRVAATMGLKPSAIRYYEAEGLLPEPMRQGDKRRYHEDVFARLELIRIGQDAGFTLSEIKTLLAGVDGGRQGTARLQRLARTRLPDIEATLTRLRLLRRLLLAATECACPDLKGCAAAARRAGLGVTRL